MEIPGTNNRPGFHASEHTYPEVTVYQHGDDPLILSATPYGGNTYEGRKSTDPSHCVYSVTTYKSIGAASGTFQVLMKPSLTSISLFKELVDDDWIDIVFYKGEHGYHVIRGLVDEVRRVRTVTAKGATVTYYLISGRDFGRVWEGTAIWFAPYGNEIISQSLSSQIMDAFPKLQLSPGAAPLVYLRDFMETLTKVKGVNWTPPKSMPGISAETFTGNVNFQDIPWGTAQTSKYYQNSPPRINFNVNALNPNGSAWDLAREYSDPAFTEMYVDVLPKEGMLSPRLSLGDPMLPKETSMTVVLRDKPFPVLPGSAPAYFPLWSSLPVHLLARQEIISDDVGKSGYERYNSFYVTPRVHQEGLSKNGLQLIAPLIDQDGIRRSGMRRMDVSAPTTPDISDELFSTLPDQDVLTLYQKKMLRDWYCMNPYFLSGTIITGHGRPDIKIGNRLYIKGRFAANPKEAEPDESYYLESVGHQWTAGPGMRSTLGVTRGWLGTDAEYMTALALVANRFQLPKVAITMP